jgi:pimeloyl-ACP methyl ester carboxylesterase
MLVLTVAVVLALAVLVYTRIVERRHPPVGRFLDCDGVRLHYVERGPPDAPPLLLLHGNGAMVQDFLSSGLVDLAARRFRVLCFDRPGFGYSSRPRARRWTPEAEAALFTRALARLGAARPLVLGHSWGTLVALALAHPVPVKGLVLVAGYYFPTGRRDVWLTSGLAVPILGDILSFTIAPVLSALLLPKLLRMIFDPRPVADSFRRGFPLPLTLRPRALRTASEESAFMVPAARRLAPSHALLRCPVAIVAADGDRLIEPEQAPRLHAMLPRATLIYIRDAGHMVHHAAPARIMEAVEEVWAEAEKMEQGHA